MSYPVVKRLFDIVLSSTALLLAGWLMFFVALILLIAHGKRGVFFIQERPGKDGKIFRLLKFKSMTDARDSNGVLLPNLERMTSVGRFIRKTSLDELPQLINVLKGDMSLIGPRPLLSRYLPFYSEREKLRHSVRPGITGWAQVNGRNNVCWSDRLEMDVWYAENISFSLDIQIFMKTIIKVFTHEGTSIEHLVPLDIERSKK